MTGTLASGGDGASASTRAGSRSAVRLSVAAHVQTVIDFGHRARP